MIRNTNKPDPMRPRFCAFCAQSNHSHCVGECECGARDHDPTVRVAAAMWLYAAASDDVGMGEVARANAWRAQDARRTGVRR